MKKSTFIKLFLIIYYSLKFKNENYHEKMEIITILFMVQIKKTIFYYSVFLLYLNNY